MTQSGDPIHLPWPPASLSGHYSSHYWTIRPIIKKHRGWAKAATLGVKPVVPETGDIHLSVTFYPPDLRGDRCNYANRMKPYFDGIADALKVNDSRFLPAYHYADPVKGGAVIVTVMP